MKTIASNKFDQTVNGYINSLYGYIFNIGNLSTYTVYEDKFLVSKPTILQRFLPFFKYYATKITLDPKYYQKPNLFALDYYGSSELEWLVLFVSGVSHPIDFNLPIIEVLPVNILNDLNKLITLYKGEVQNSKNNPDAYTSKNIDISRQSGFIEERYLYKNTSNLTEKLLSLTSKNRLPNTSTIIRTESPTPTPNTNRFIEGNTTGVGLGKDKSISSLF
jgi:hypothetical protein